MEAILPFQASRRNSSSATVGRSLPKKLFDTACVALSRTLPAVRSKDHIQTRARVVAWMVGVDFGRVNKRLLDLDQPFKRFVRNGDWRPYVLGCGDRSLEHDADGIVIADRNFGKMLRGATPDLDMRDVYGFGAMYEQRANGKRT
ncbi:hypothetical protein MA20_02715 [Bradyrhizobium japonicum]|uniref:Uncharacterized protein n=2 Tax=Bradyrhizobium TaxID=374 RepID=A0A0A3Z704_BRAJP|nr:hypothetical protein RN69_14755 [Bradyrhizobium japonicum]KGT81668.1 hypothetical protein MA20_02715 [Bradyrhizobium japonicum]KMJ95207.1 hypothetical protein CF64_33710 [Bradyrhizobium japonicum]